MIDAAITIFFEDKELCLSESSVSKLDKAGKTAGLQRSKTLDISSRNRKLWKDRE